MGFGMFVTWVLVGMLVGVMLVGSIGLGWMVTMAFVAAVGAASAIVAQRMLMATELPADNRRVMWRCGFGAVLGAAVIWMTLAPAPPPAAIAVADLKAMERIEQGSGRVAAAPKLTGQLALKDTSAAVPTSSTPASRRPSPWTSSFPPRP